MDGNSRKISVLGSRFSVIGSSLALLGAALTSCDDGSMETGSQGSSAHRLYDASNKIPTTNSGREYRIECEGAGVPVPRSLIDETDGWVNRGEIFTEFLSSGFEAELWTWEIDAGICMALPRWDVDEAALFGLICFGYDTGNTCFWDNQNENFLDRYQAHSIDDLIGGAALKDNGGGCLHQLPRGREPLRGGPLRDRIRLGHGDLRRQLAHSDRA